jgi:DNA-binding MarR family transcriptional regulator
MVSHGTDGVPPVTAAASVLKDPAARAVLDGIRRIVRSLREESRASERVLGLSAAQVFVLHRLASAPALSVNELAERTLTHQSSVSVVVSKLCARGLVARTASATDARRVELSLTRQGRVLLSRAPANAPQDRLLAALALIGSRGRKRLADALGELVGAMALAEEPAAMFFEAAPARVRRSRGRRHASNA